MKKSKESKSVTMFTGLKPDVHIRLEAAVLEIFSEYDFHKASIRDIAKKAGVSFSTIYKHYDSKEKLLFAFIDYWMGDLTERIIDHLQGIEDLKEKLRKVFWIQLDYYEKHPGLGKILFMTLPMKTWMSDESFRQEKMTSLFLDVFHKGQKEGFFDPDIEPKIMLDLLMGLTQRTFFMWVSRGEKEGLAKQANKMFNMVWRALSKPEVVPYGF